MKRIFTVGAGLLTLAILFVVACQKLAKEEAIEPPSTELPSTVTTIYERGEVDYDPSIFGDHTYKIETISLNDAFLQPIKNDTQWTNHGLAAKIDLSKPIKRYSLDWSEMQIVEVPLVSNSKTECIYIYTFKNQYLFVRGTLDTLSNENQKIQFESLNGTPYYGVEINPEGYMGNFTVDNNMPFDATFTNATEADRTDIPFTECQQTYPSSMVWCMNCALSSCADNWGCTFVCIYIPGNMIHCAASWAVRCSRIKGVNSMF